MAWLRAKLSGSSSASAGSGQQAINPRLEAWASRVDVSGVSDRVAANIDDFLRSYRRMPWYARREIGFRLVSVVSSQVTPPPSELINPLDVLATVLAKRERIRGPARPDAS